MYIDKFKQEDGSYLIEGVTYQDAESVLQTKMMNFCGCGDPESSLMFVRNVLNKIDGMFENKKFWEEAEELCGGRGQMYFILYVIDNMGMTEHGGSVPGWLTKPGKAFLEDLNEYFETKEKEDE